MTLPTDVKGLSRDDHRAHHTTLHARHNTQVWAHEYASLQHAVDAAVTRGGVVYIPPQGVTIDTPLTLPRGDSDGGGGVWLVGVGRQPHISGAATFPKDRALIEWPAATGHVWNQRIENVTLALPNVPGVKAVHYPLSDNSTWDAMQVQRLQIVMRDVHILCHNDYHETLLDFEGCVWYSELTNIIGNPIWGNNTYDTLLLKAGRDLWDVARLIPDAPGLFNCTLHNLYSTWLRGGRSRMFEGRIHFTTWHNAFCDGGSTGPGYHFIGAAQSQLVNLGTEGREDKPANWLFEDCASMSIVNAGIGVSYNFKGTGFGHGMELRNCRDMHFDGRLTGTHNAVYSLQSEGKRLLYVDAKCKRCTFDRWQVKGQVITDEIEIAGDDSNRVEYVLFKWQAEEVGTLRGKSAIDSKIGA
jgi:hypothetical protein